MSARTCTRASGTAGRRAVRGARRRAVRLALIAALVAVAAPPSASAAEEGAGPLTVRAFATIEPDTATVGDRLKLTVRIERPPGTEVARPDVAAAIAPLEVLESAPLPPVERGGLAIDETVFVVAAFETGIHGIPPLTFRYASASGDTGFARTDSTSVTVVTVLPEDEEELAPRDIKPPVDLPRRIWPFVLAAAAAAALMIAYRYLRSWWRRWRRPAEERPEEPRVPPRAAHLVAFERLEALRRDDPIGRGEIEAFYVTVTDIVRRYLRDRFAVDAIDMTTAELAPALEGARIAPDETSRVVDYLAHADLAKFAKLHPDAARARADLDLAWEFVERTRFRDEDGATAGGSTRTADGGRARGEAGGVEGGLDASDSGDVDHSGGAGARGETAPVDREESP